MRMIRIQEIGELDELEIGGCNRIVRVVTGCNF